MARSTSSYRRRAALLTPGERRFYHHGLQPAVRNRWLIAPKVRLTDVLAVRNLQSPAGRRISQKHVDFVLVTPKAMRIAIVVELNDSSHDTTERQRRDELIAKSLATAGVPFVTFPVYRRYDPERIRQVLQRAVRGRD